MKHMSHDEFQDPPVHQKPMRLHQTENESSRTIFAFMHNSDCGVVAFQNHIYLNFTLQDRGGIIQNGIGRLRRIAIAGEVI